MGKLTAQNLMIAFLGLCGTLLCCEVSSAEATTQNPLIAGDSSTLQLGKPGLCELLVIEADKESSHIDTNFSILSGLQTKWLDLEISSQTLKPNLSRVAFNNQRSLFRSGLSPPRILFS